MNLPTGTARINPSHKNPAEYRAPGGDRNSRPNYFAISSTRGMVFADGHTRHLGLDVSAPLK
jgi:hypothetical protein